MPSSACSALLPDTDSDLAADKLPSNNFSGTSALSPLAAFCQSCSLWEAVSFLSAIAWLLVCLMA